MPAPPSLRSPAGARGSRRNAGLDRRTRVLVLDSGGRGLVDRRLAGRAAAPVAERQGERRVPARDEAAPARRGSHRVYLLRVLSSCLAHVTHTSFEEASPARA